MTTARESFQALFDAHFIRVIRFAERRTGDTQVAEDIAGETFELAWSRLQDQSVTAPWLYKTAGFKVKEHFRRSKRKHSAETALRRRVQEPAQRLEAVESLALLDALEALTSREREIVQLTYWEGLSAVEVGEAVGCRPATVWVVLTRARAKMRPLLVSQPEEVHRR